MSITVPPAARGRLSLEADFDVEAVRADFPILCRQIGDRPLVYLDSAATSQKPVQVLDAVERYYRESNSNVHRGAHTLGNEATELFENARRRVAAFIDADPRGLVFTRNATESLNLVAYGYGRKFVREGDEILLTQVEHHSNIVPWQFVAQATGASLRYVGLGDDGLLDLSDLGGLITDRTKVVFAESVANPSGSVADVEGLADVAHAAGVPLMIDATVATPYLSRPMEWGVSAASLVTNAAVARRSFVGLARGGFTD